MPATSVSLRQALHLLNFQNYKGEPPSRRKIQQNFVAAAKRLHPDARHDLRAAPCAESFRQCHEARAVLLEHYHGIHRKGGTRKWKPRAEQWSAAAAAAAQGFPYNTLRILSLKQSLALRGMVAGLLIIGLACDKLRIQMARENANAELSASASASE